MNIKHFFHSDYFSISFSFSPAEKMAAIIFGGFQVKSCFILLLSITLALSVTLYVSDISFQSSEVWLSNVTKQIHSYYRSGIFQKLNQTLNQTEQTSSAMQDAPHLSEESTVLVNSKSLLYHEAYPRNYNFIIDEPNKCKEENPFLVLMVPVAPHEIRARHAIRNTWGNESVVQGKSISVIFVLGLPGVAPEEQQEELRLESQEFHDLVQSSFMDTYSNLTIKTMVIMDWVATHCPQAAYAMKVDSDMFLNVENLMSLLLAHETPRENYITGMIMSNRSVIRDENSKWYVPRESYTEDFYPVYLLGMGYIFSNDLPKKITETSKYVKPFRIEDAYIGVCLKQLGVAPSNPPNPSQFRAYFSGTYDREQFARVITTILGSPQQLVEFWQGLKRHTNRT